MFRLVMIDDEPWALKGLAEVIDWHAHGFSVVAMYDNPFTALEHLSTDQPDVIFTDIRMPGMTGLELMERCRAQGASALFVIISAFAEFEYAKTAIDNNAFSYVLKPLLPDQMEKFADRLYRRVNSEKEIHLQRTITACVSGTYASESGAPWRAPLVSFRECERSFYIYLSDAEAEAENKQAYRSFRVPPGRRLYILPSADTLQTAGLHGGGISSMGCGPEELPAKIREAMVAYYTQHFFAVSYPLQYRTCVGETAADGTALLRAAQEGDRKKVQLALFQLEQKIRSSHDDRGAGASVQQSAPRSVRHACRLGVV